MSEETRSHLAFWAVTVLLLVSVLLLVVPSRPAARSDVVKLQDRFPSSIPVKTVRVVVAPEPAPAAPETKPAPEPEAKPVATSARKVKAKQEKRRKVRDIDDD